MSAADGAAALTRLVSGALHDGETPEDVFEALVLCVATFIAGAHGSPVDHRFMAEMFGQRVLIEIPKASHRLAQLAREQRR